MFGHHISSSMLSSTAADDNMLSSCIPIVKDFLSNEEGFLSSKYVNTLKKYYTLEIAEKLFIYHGLCIKGYTKDYHERNYGTRSVSVSTMPHVSPVARFVTLCWSLEGKRPERCTSSWTPVNWVVEELYGRNLKSVNHYGLAQRGDDRLNSQADYSLREYLRFQKGLAIASVTPYDAYVDNVPEHLKALHRRDFSSICKHATADTMQAFFHHPSTIGYNGGVLLGDIFRDIHENHESEAGDGSEEAVENNDAS